MAPSDGPALVAPFVAAEATARQDPAQPLELNNVSSGAALEDLQVGIKELTVGGLSQVGSPTVVSTDILTTDMKGDPPTATVRVCLDYSQVDLVNSSGQSAKDPSAPQRVPTDLTLSRIGGKWLVTNRTFPDQVGC